MLVAGPVAAAGVAAYERRLGEDAFADDVGARVEQAVDGLQAEIAHADTVRVGIAERDWQPPAPVLRDRAYLAVESKSGTLEVASIQGLSLGSPSAEEGRYVQVIFV